MKFKLVIVGSVWTVRVLPKRAYNRKHGKDSLAVTVFYKRRIDLSPIGCTEKTIIHELVHAYLYECCLHDRDEMGVGALEEAFCDMMAKFGARILRQARGVAKQIETLHSTAVARD